MNPEALTKVYVDLPNHRATGGESMWAMALGADAYELRNVPFHAYDLNHLDVVEAIPTGPGLKPQVRHVIRRSGHRTLRVIFLESTPEVDRRPLLAGLVDLGATTERATDILFAIDISPGGDCQGVRDRLDAWDELGLLKYETCEARAEGSFDDLPESELAN